MNNLFDTTTIANLTLPNRFIRSATWEGMADKDGTATEHLAETLAELARGEVGMIITGHAFVSREGQAGPFQLGVYSSELLPGLQRMTEAVHDAGSTIVLQLAHAGCQASYKLTGLNPLAPSSQEREKGIAAKAMSKDEILHTVEAFSSAAEQAINAGFDGVQIHAAHGYLLSQFLSPWFNHRTDEYGGSLENRARIVLEILAAVRRVAGPDYPIIIKMNSEDFHKPGFSLADMLKTAALLEQAGIDAIELSGGTVISDESRQPVRKGDPKSEDEEVYYRAAARRFKTALSVPLILVGGIRSYTTAKQLVQEGLTDYIALSRPLIREPDLVARWHRGDTTRATCISCNLCFGPAMRGNGITCVVEEKQKSMY